MVQAPYVDIYPLGEDSGDMLLSFLLLCDYEGHFQHVKLR